eukprot:TRINITY_DN66739_c0_g1_i1.p3 TRINITY_DN66739_c0_g1~~TRINITY_DN66739_c0_g1_i1.p3  ORF type:complete len:113 (+),score=23.93 TRINITY_DN66739_c0_g1_i1:111-449(+)
MSNSMCSWERVSRLSNDNSCVRRVGGCLSLRFQCTTMAASNVPQPVRRHVNGCARRSWRGMANVGCSSNTTLVIMRFGSMSTRDGDDEDAEADAEAEAEAEDLALRSNDTRR